MKFADFSPLHRYGAILHIDDTPLRSEAFSLAGALVEIKEDRPWIAVHTDQETERHPDRLTILADKALDFLSAVNLLQARRTGPMSFVSDLYWGQSPQGRLVVSARGSVDDMPPRREMSTVTLANGGKQIGPSFTPLMSAHWRDYLSYWRLAQTSQSTSEQARLLWLCFERCISELHPKKPKQKDTHWINEALTRFWKSDARPIFRDGYISSPADFTAKIYGLLRTRIFHSKIDHDVLLPGLAVDELHEVRCATAALSVFTRWLIWELDRAIPICQTLSDVDRNIERIRLRNSGAVGMISTSMERTPDPNDWEVVAESRTWVHELIIPSSGASWILLCEADCHNDIPPLTGIGIRSDNRVLYAGRILAPLKLEKSETLAIHILHTLHPNNAFPTHELSFKSAMRGEIDRRRNAASGELTPSEFLSGWMLTSSLLD